jgi:ethanolamine ammonia-lyase small subunit
MDDLWASLRRFTQARIGQGRAGHALRTPPLLDFQLAHALARDAVHLPWDVECFAEQVRELGLEAVVLATPVRNRTQYLKRPDLGRVLEEASRDRILANAGEAVDVALAISNGLSSAAVENHGLSLLTAVVDALRSRNPPVSADDATSPMWKLGPVCLVPNGRVALSDPIGVLLRARLSVMIVGERPGLSAADSLGIYMTYRPDPANTDAERNCISNIRPPNGVGYREAAAKLAYLAGEALRLGVSGVGLKDDMAVVEPLETDKRQALTGQAPGLV